MTRAETQAKAATMTSQQRIAVGVKVLSDSNAPFTQQQRQAYLLDCGLTSSEYLEALNQASNGELLRNV